MRARDERAQVCDEREVVRWLLMSGARGRIGRGGEARTDAEGADEDADDVCVAGLLDDGVASHQEFVRTSGFQPGETGLGIVCVHLMSPV